LDKVGIQIELGNLNNLIENEYDNVIYSGLYNIQRQTWFSNFIYLSIIVNTIALGVDK